MAAARMLAYRRFFVAALSAKALTDIHAALNTALVLGNEFAGLSPDIMALCDHTIHLPMQGTKVSLNVGVAFGIAAYHLQSHLQA